MWGGGVTSKFPHFYWFFHHFSRVCGGALDPMANETQMCCGALPQSRRHSVKSGRQQAWRGWGACWTLKTAEQRQGGRGRGSHSHSNKRWTSERTRAFKATFVRSAQLGSGNSSRLQVRTAIALSAPVPLTLSIGNARVLPKHPPVKPGQVETCVYFNIPATLSAMILFGV